MTRRLLRLSDLEESVSEVRSLQSNGYVRAAQWNLAMVCQHLTNTHRMSIEGPKFSFPFFVRPIARLILLKKVMRGDPSNFKAKAPASLAPTEVPDKDDYVDEYVATVNKVVAVSTELHPMHPVFGRFSRDQWLRFHAWHAAHHLSFLLPKNPRSETASV